MMRHASIAGARFLDSFGQLLTWKFNSYPCPFKLEVIEHAKLVESGRHAGCSAFTKNVFVDGVVKKMLGGIRKLQCVPFVEKCASSLDITLMEYVFETQNDGYPVSTEMVCAKALVVVHGKNVTSVCSSLLTSLWIVHSSLNSSVAKANRRQQTSTKRRWQHDRRDRLWLTSAIRLQMHWFRFWRRDIYFSHRRHLHGCWWVVPPQPQPPEFRSPHTWLTRIREKGDPRSWVEPGC